MLVERRQPLGQKHGWQRQGQDGKRDGEEIAGRHLRVQRLRLGLVIQAIGPAQGAHRHAEALDAHGHANHLQRLQVHHAPFAQRVEDRHKDDAPSGAGRVRDNRADDADAGQEPQPRQQLRIEGNGKQQQGIGDQQHAAADHHQPPLGQRAQSRLGRSHLSAVAISTPRRRA